MVFGGNAADRSNFLRREFADARLEMRSLRIAGDILFSDEALGDDVLIIAFSARRRCRPERQMWWHARDSDAHADPSRSAWRRRLAAILMKVAGDERIDRRIGANTYTRHHIAAANGAIPAGSRPSIKRRNRRAGPPRAVIALWSQTPGELTVSGTGYAPSVCEPAETNPVERSTHSTFSRRSDEASGHGRMVRALSHHARFAERVTDWPRYNDPWSLAKSSSHAA